MDPTTENVIDKRLNNFTRNQVQSANKFSHKRIQRLASVNVTVAQTIPLQIDIEGTAIECDASSTGFVTVQLDSTREAGRTFMPGYWMTGNKFSKVFLTWTAQSNGTCTLNCWQDDANDRMQIG
jgi:hypothetical protein